MMKRLLVIVPLLAVVVSFSARSAEHTKDTPEQVKKAVIEKKAVIVDVREVEEWKAGHIQDAIPLPLSELKNGVNKDKLKQLLPEGKVIYLHCAAGGRCLKAADALKAAGFETRPLKPGFEDLIKEGLEKAK